MTKSINGELTSYFFQVISYSILGFIQMGIFRLFKASMNATCNKYMYIRIRFKNYKRNPLFLVKKQLHCTV